VTGQKYMFEGMSSVATRSTRAKHAPVTLRVPFAASSVALARKHLKSWLTEYGAPRDVIEDGRVVLSELVANSIRHAEPLADGTLLITWKLERRGLQMSVSDGGSPTRPRKVNAPSSALAGRGMAIVESLCVAWWADKTRSQSTVHAILELG
jgi:anti-sigma regulatory factor (Ser/Thr protein kinase)